MINFYYEEGENGPFKPVVRDVNLVNITVDKATKPSRVSNVEGMHFDNVTVNGNPVSGIDDLPLEVS